MLDRRTFFKNRVPKYRKDIALFASEVCHFDPDEWQRAAFRSIETTRYTAVKSGQGVGKTGTEAVVVLWFLACFPYPRVVCTAPTRQQLHDVLWSEIAKWQSESPLLSEILRWTKTYVYMTDYERRWFAVARTATKPENMQGFHAKNMLFIVDEASGVADPIMEAILGTLSGRNNKLLLCGNPTKTSGAFYDAFHASRAIYSCHTVSSEDSPRTNKDNIALLERKYGRNSNVFRVRVLGEFPMQEDDVFISLSLLEQSTERMAEADEAVDRITIGADIARFGDDETVLATLVGQRISIPIIRQGQDTMRTVGDIVATYNRLLAENAEYSGSVIVNIDDGGLGGGVTDRLKELKAEGQLPRLVIVPVNFGSRPPQTDGDMEHYKDMTTYLWAGLKNMMESHSVVLQNDNELIAQLSVRKYYLASDGKLKLESKDDMKKRGIKSPDRGDAVSLACFQQARVYDEWAEKAHMLVITVAAAMTMRPSEISIGVSVAGHFGAAMVATQVIGDGQKAVVIGARRCGTVETDALGKEFADFAHHIYRTYKRLDYVNCDKDDALMLKSLRTAAQHRGLPPVIRYAVDAPLDDRVKLTARLIAQNRLFLTIDSRALEQAFSSATWADSRSNARGESIDASLLTAFEYTIERRISRFLMSEAVKR